MNRLAEAARTLNEAAISVIDATRYTGAPGNDELEEALHLLYDARIAINRALAEHDASDGEFVHDEPWLERQANALYDLEVYEIAVPSGIDIARDYAEHLHKRDTEKETSDD